MVARSLDGELSYFCLRLKPIGAKQGILTKHKQNPYENEVWNSQNPIYNLFLALKEEIYIKYIGTRQGILRKHKQNPYKNGTGKQAKP